MVIQIVGIEVEIRKKVHWVPINRISDRRQNMDVDFLAHTLMLVIKVSKIEWRIIRNECDMMLLNFSLDHWNLQIDFRNSPEIRCMCIRLRAQKCCKRKFPGGLGPMKPQAAQQVRKNAKIPWFVWQTEWAGPWQGWTGRNAGISVCQDSEYQLQL